MYPAKLHVYEPRHEISNTGISTSVDSDEPVQPPFKLWNFTCTCCSVISLPVILIDYSSDWPRIWSHGVYAQADRKLCWSHIPHYSKHYVAVHIWFGLSLSLDPYFAYTSSDTWWACAHTQLSIRYKNVLFNAISTKTSYAGLYSENN